MSQLNKKKISPSINPAPFGLGVSGNGNIQPLKGPQHILFETVVSTLYGKDSFYETGNETVARMKTALTSVINTHGLKGAEYAGRVALFAREHMYIRTMPIVMVVELAKIMQDRSAHTASAINELDNLIKLNFPAKINIGLLGTFYDGNSALKNGSVYQVLTVDEMKVLRQSLAISPPVYKIRELVKGVISRADELTDLYAYAITVFGDSKKIPMGLKRGVADAFNKFDAYQLGKYNRSEGLTLKNLLRIVHPVPAGESNSAIFKKIMDESLESPYTWEVELSKNGQLGAQKMSNKDLWTQLITREGSGSLGYMALLRNLRNMKEAGIDDATWKLVASKISNPKAVEKSKQLPFGFINAYDIAKESGVPGIVLNALQDATEQSLKNMPKLGDRVWIILDCSGSMNNFAYSAGAKPTTNSPIKIGAIFGAALVKASAASFECKFTMFDDYAKFVDLNPRDSIFTLYEKIMKRNAGGGTNLASALAVKSDLGFEPDTVIILSDMEVNRLNGDSVDKIFKGNTVKVAINLNGRDTTPLSEVRGWTQLSGWSPRIFQFVKFSRDSDSIVKQLFDGGKIPLSGEVVEED